MIDEERHIRQTREEGMEEGYANGMKQGIKQEKEQMAVNLLKTGILTEEQIRDVTGLEQAELERLRKKIKSQ